MRYDGTLTKHVCMRDLERRISVEFMTAASSRGSASGSHREALDPAISPLGLSCVLGSLIILHGAFAVQVSGLAGEDGQHEMFCEQGSASMRLSQHCGVE